MQMKPKIHLFNPGYETGIALYAASGSTHYTPARNVQQMQRDLAWLPLWFADLQDYVWVGNQDTAEPTDFLPGELSAWATPLSMNTLNDSAFHLPETEVAPWGLSPHSIHFFEDLRKRSGQPLWIPPWNDQLTRLVNRQTAADCLNQLLKHIPEIPSHTPVFCSSLGEVEAYMHSHTPAHIIKTPYSSSGRGVYEVTGSRLQEKESQWIAGALQKQGAISIEPRLDKKTDFAMEFFLDEDENIRFEGYSLFDTAPSGAYIGNRLASQPAIEAYIAQPIGLPLLHQVREATARIIQQTYGKYYKGNIGVDMMIYTDKNGDFAIQPCVEINMRNTMGMISVHLFRQYIDPDATGYFKVVYEKDAYKQHTVLREQYPQEWKNGKLLKGYLPLCPVHPETFYRAYIIV